MRLAFWQARLVLTISQFAADGIVRALGVSRQADPGGGRGAGTRISQPPNQGEVVRTAKRLGIPKGARWLVYVGGFSPHRRYVEALVRAHAALARESEGGAPHLVLVGATTGDAFFGEDFTRIRAAIDAGRGTAALVHWTGFLPDSALRLVHAGALALVLPSMCEGFGLTAVEAAASGAPVIATTESPLPQLLKGGGLFIAPGDLRRIWSARYASSPPTNQAGCGWRGARDIGRST